MIVGLIIFLATLENMWPFIVGLLNTPPGYVFLGTVHHPPDYFYYLSQFALGQFRWVQSIDLYTAEPIGPTFIGWTNVIFGKLFSLMGFSAFGAYHVSVALGTIALLFLSYRLARRIIPTGATLALFLFLLTHAFSVTRDGQASYGDYYANYAVPRVRFGGVPHQLILHAASIAAVILYMSIRAATRIRITSVALLAVTSITLASVQPVLWGVLFGSFILTEFISLTHTPVHMRRTLIALAVFALPGIPILVALNAVFGTLPFSQLRIWESLQQTPLTLEHFLTATGPVFLLALLFIAAFMRTPSWGRIFAVVFAASSYTLFLSPIPHTLSISHVRFMSSLTILCTAMISSDGIVALRQIRPHVRGVPILITTLLLVLTAYLIPNHIKTLRLVTNFSPTNAFHYLPQDTYTALIRAGRMMDENNTALITWPYNELFPGLTGRRSYDWHPLLTIRPEEKTRVREAFFTDTTPDQAWKLVKNDGITHVIARQDSHIEAFPFLKEEFSMGNITLYRVTTD